MRYFFVEPAALEAHPVAITGIDARHIFTVLHYRPGDTIGLLDGTGSGYRAEICQASPAKVTVKILGELPFASRPTVRLVVAQAYLKDKKMDHLVRRLCELGMAEWKPFVSARSVARPPEKRMAARFDRWQSIAREAIKQCRRADLPVINSCISFDTLMAESGGCSRRIMFWEQVPEAVNWSESQEAEKDNDGFMVVLGPEGGFTRDEVMQARDHGFTIAGLGPRVLRADTAAVAAATIIQYIFGDMGPKTY